MDDARRTSVQRTATVYRALGVAITTVGVLALVELFTITESIGFGAILADLGLSAPGGVSRLSLLLVAAFGPPVGLLLLGLADHVLESTRVDGGLGRNQL